MTTPRTIAGQAALSAMRPWVKRALGRTIVRIETEAAAPYRAALLLGDGLFAEIAAMDAASAWERAARVDLVERAAVAHRLAGPLLTESAAEQLD